MSSDLAVSVRGLGKDYRIRHAPRSVSVAEELTGGLRRRLGREDPRQMETFSALRDVSFDVSRGDVLGIIGRNGAGKSTLLKILSRITDPTRGEVRLHGRVGALLEVGAGFHPELTGRENIYLNGAILGMERREVSRLFDAIVDFAEVERFIDTPVKRYSSGMYVRLAFAVAAHVLPEILIVDEVLAVGDTAFQKKCLGRMGDAARGGRTVLFVSHNMQVVNALCTRAVLIENGAVTLTGEVAECVSAYQVSVGSGQRVSAAFRSSFPDLGLLGASVDQEGESGALQSTKPTRVTLLVRAQGLPAKELTVGWSLLDPYGNAVLSTYFDDLDERPHDEVLHGDVVMTCTVPANTLNEGVHQIRFNVSEHKVRKATDDEEHVLGFEIVNVDGVGSRFGLGRDHWRDTALLPAWSWELMPARAFS